MKNLEETKAEFMERCTACGICAAMCPPFGHRLVSGSCQEIQKQVRAYLGSEPPEEAVIERSRLCNECYKCVPDTCPQGLNPMRTNQLLRGLLNEQGRVPLPFTPPSDVLSDERIAATLLTTEEEFARITTPARAGDGRTLFFPGCNIYYQPNLLLTAMDIMDRINGNWTYLPGLDHCCGSNHDSAGRLPAGERALKDLATAMENPRFETVVVWCPTCAARFHQGGIDIPVITFARFVADRIDAFPEGIAHEGSLTLHEPCKNAYLGLDPVAPRQILERISGKPVKEMVHHGSSTVCCGWSLLMHQPDSWEELIKSRLLEAEKTGAKTLATVCHGCQWIMDRPWKDDGVRVVNYVKLAGDALGIRHPERLRKLRELGSREAVMEALEENTGERIDRLPSGKEQVTRVIDIILGTFYGSGL